MKQLLNHIYSENLILLFFISFVAVIFWAHINVYFNFKKDNILKTINLFLLITAIILIVISTLSLRRTVYQGIDLTPLAIIIKTQKSSESFRSFFMNIILFLPFGLSLPFALPDKFHKRNIIITIVFACVLSAAIEFLQYYYRLGRCETDDVIANTLGAAIGTLSYLLYLIILKKREKGSYVNIKINNNQKLLLDLCSKSLFGIDVDLTENIDVDELFEEAMRQTVFSLVFSHVKHIADNNTDKFYSQIISKNIRVEYGHNEVHNVLSANNIPYVVLKGVSSSGYYPEPTLRTMGDIDVLVSPEDIFKADNALKSIGFVTKDSIDNEKHIAYKRRDGLVCELHRQINGIPQNAAGEHIKKYFDNIFAQSKHIKNSNSECIVPDKFHHGIILLLHTATHLTHEGVGLRHLCDWAVYVNSFSDVEFEDLFKLPLKKMGLWRFAVLLTQCCEKYLGCNKKYLTSESDHKFIDSVMVDILNGGNFGNKDVLRYNQIKYISDRKSGNVSKKSPILQLLASINQKTKNEFKFTTKFKILLPIGWLFTIFKYLYLVIIGKRTLDNFEVMNYANKRKNIYNNLHLFEKD